MTLALQAANADFGHARSIIAVLGVIVTAVAGIIAFTIGIVAMIFRRPEIHDDVGDVLIIAAHQDDCVISAGEYAIEAISRGRQVWILYFTCGAERPTAQRATVRRAEAISAWADVGVPDGRIVFLPYAQSSVSGPVRSTESDIEEAIGVLCKIVSKLPYMSQVFVPAAGESHCDHRVLRRIALGAIHTSGRRDLQVFETPEYNGYYSLWRSPQRSFAYFCKQMPFVPRRVRFRSAITRARFVDGGPGLILLPKSDRLERKKELLRLFPSENAERLVMHFGHSDLFRPVPHQTSFPQPAEERPRGYIRIRDKNLDYALATLGVALIATLVEIPLIVVRVGGWLGGVILFPILVGSIWQFARSADWEGKVIYGTLIVGISIAAIPNL